MPYLRQSTAQTFRFGPFLDATNGVDEEVALTITPALRRLSKDGGAFASASGAVNATHDSDGWYSAILTTTDTATVGELILNVQVPATHLPVWMRWWVLEEAIYDDLFGAAATGYNTVTPPTAAAIVNEWESQSQADPTGFWVNVREWIGVAPNALAAGRVDTIVGGFATGAITGPAFAANAIGATAIAANAFDSKGDWLPANLPALTTDAGGSTTTLVDGGLTELVNVHNGNLIHFLSGSLIGQTRIIMDFNATTDTLTFAPPTTASVGAGFSYRVHPHCPVDVQSWLGIAGGLLAPSALVSGRVDSSTGANAAGVITAAALATDAVDKIRDGLLPTQNAAFNNLEFLFVSSGDHATPVTGAGTMAVTRSIDGGAFGAGTGTGPAEVGNGIYQYDASAADMNGGIITFRFTATTGTPAAPDDRFVTVVTGGGV